MYGHTKTKEHTEDKNTPWNKARSENGHSAGQAEHHNGRKLCVVHFYTFFNHKVTAAVIQLT